MPLARRPLTWLAVAAAAAAVAVPVATASPAGAEDGPDTGDTIVGELVQGYADPEPPAAAEPVPDHDEGELLSWIQTAPGEAVRVPTGDVAEVTAGSTVEVTVGETVRDEAADAGLEPAREVLAADVVTGSEPPTAATTAPVNHPVTVVMLQPAGSVRDGTTLGQVVAAVDGPVADFWEQQSNGAVRFGVADTHDWPASASAAGCDRPFALWEEAARRANWSGGPGRHLLVYVPANSPGCAYGLGTIGQGLGSGGLLYVRATGTSVLAHEFGHNLGLGHASELQCDRAVEEAATTACRTAAYADFYDVMGVSWQQVGSLGAPHAALLGLLPEGSAPTVAAGAASGEHVLAPVGSRAGTRAVRLLDADGDEYWIEYRTATGQDAWLGTPATARGLQSGVLIRRAGAEGADDSSLLLDATPSARGSWDADSAMALPVGVPVSFGGGGSLTVTVLEATDTGARVQIAHPIDAAHDRLGGTPVLGAPTSDRICGLPDGGCRRSYAAGSLYWWPRTGRVTLLGAAVAARYEQLGGPAALGYPLGDERDASSPAVAGRLASFPGGDIVWSAGTGAHVLRGSILSMWRELGAQSGAMGFPTGDDMAVPGGYRTDFQAGAIYWSAATGAKGVRGAVQQKYESFGGPAVLGFPVAHDGPTPTGNGAMVRLQRGEVVWSASTGAHVVRGAILSMWRELGAQAGPMGFPTGDDAAVPGGSRTAFQTGAIYWSAATGARGVRGAVQQKYESFGGPAVLGFPVAHDGATADGTGALVRLQGGDIYWSAGTGAHVVRGALLATWRELGAHTGPMGYPTGDDMAVPGGYKTDFRNGSLYWSAATGARGVRGALQRKYESFGGPAVLGFPVAHDGATADGTGALVRLQGGVVYWSPATGAHVVRGAILERWRRDGAQTGALGYPVADPAPLADGTGVESRFQRGSIVEHADGRVEVRLG